MTETPGSDPADAPQSPAAPEPAPAQPAPPPQPPPAPALPAAPPLSEQVPPPDPPATGRLILGIAAGVALYAVAYALSFVDGRDENNYWAIGYAILGFFVTVILLVAGIVLTIVRRTKTFGAGVLISIAIGVLCGGGVCVALLRAA